MLPKKNRVNKKDIDSLFKRGKTLFSQNLNFKFLLEETSNAQISVIVPKSVSKLAIKRNLLRRRGYDALKKYINMFPNLKGTIVFKKYQDDKEILENEIKGFLDKVN